MNEDEVFKSVNGDKFEVEGPFEAETGNFVIYMLRGSYEGQESTVGIITVNDTVHIELVSENLSELFNCIIRLAAESLVNWKEVPCYLGIMNKEISSSSQKISQDMICETYTCETYDTNERDLKKIALEIISKSIIISQIDSNGKTYKIFKEVEEGVPEYNVCRIQEEGSNIGRSVIARKGQDLTFLGELLPIIEENDAQLYYQEAMYYLSVKDIKSSFHSFYYFVQFVPKESRENIKQIIWLGHELSKNILNTQPDLAEWTSSIVARYAEDLEMYDVAAEAQRFAGIASQSLGRINECIEHYESAIRLFDKISDERVKARIQMSYGISIVWLLMYCEPENILPTKSDNLIKLLHCAEVHLKCARETLLKFDDDSSRHSLCSIDLDLIRIEDLYGNHLSAHTKLTQLTNGNNKSLLDPKLILTAVFYNILIGKKLADCDETYLQSYYELIDQASELFIQTEDKLPYYCCIFHALRGDILLKHGRYEEAIRDLSQAYAIQLKVCQDEVRPPSPERKYGTYSGIKTIDLCGKIQHAFILMGTKSNDSRFEHECLLNALCFADNSKGQFFKRDMSYLLTKPPDELSPLLLKKGKSLLELMAKGFIDQRIIKADYDWYLEEDLPKEKAQLLLQDGINTNINPEDLINILLRREEKVAFLSLYSTSKNTIIYLMHDPQKPPVIKILDFSLDKLESVVNQFHTGMSGSRRYRPFDSKNPKVNQRFFEPFLSIMGMFDSLIPTMEISDLILISPHGLWHELPLHAYILPKMWANDCSPGLLYIPSISLFDLLNRREAEDETHFKRIGLSVVPASEDSKAIDLFLESYEKYKEIFKGAGIDILACFGKEVTAERLFEVTKYVGLHHIISHGTFVKDNPMESKLLVSDGENLPSKAILEDCHAGQGEFIDGTIIMANGTVANTVVVQACYLGKARAAYGDEFWGIVRSMIFAGANCVIAPMWNVDLKSSTALLTNFYKSWIINKEPKYSSWTKAQRNLYQNKENSEWCHFYHWAALRMVGC